MEDVPAEVRSNLPCPSLPPRYAAFDGRRFALGGLSRGLAIFVEGRVVVVLFCFRYDVAVLLPFVRICLCRAVLVIAARWICRPAR